MTDQNIGKKLGNYRIDHLIGEGGMSHVYEGRHEKFERRYAIKVLRPELTIQASVRWRFENEAKVMDKLNDCRDIINVSDFYEEGSFLAIIMEFLEGETLKDRIKKGAMSPAAVKEIFPRILDAFKYAHDRKIVHRDVKPSNIFLLRNGEIRILDFGIAKFTDNKEDHTATGAQMGTVIYMSPEQVLDSKHLDYHSDIYSLGVMLYHCLTGASPYNTETVSRFEIQTKIVNEPLSELETIPEPYRSIIARCTAKKPEDRFQSCEEIKQVILAGKTTPLKKVNDDETVLDIAPAYKKEEPKNRKYDETVLEEDKKLIVENTEDKNAVMENTSAIRGKTNTAKPKSDSKAIQYLDATKLVDNKTSRTHILHRATAFLFDGLIIFIFLYLLLVTLSYNKFGNATIEFYNYEGQLEYAKFYHYLSIMNLFEHSLSDLLGWYLSYDSILFILAFIFVVVSFVYFTFLENTGIQTTLGKFLLGIRVVKEGTMERITFLQSLKRQILKPVTIINVPGWFAVTDNNFKPFHDSKAKTEVVKENNKLEPVFWTLFTILLFACAFLYYQNKSNLNEEVPAEVTPTYIDTTAVADTTSVP